MISLLASFFAFVFLTGISSAKEAPAPSFDKDAFIRSAAARKELSLSIRECIELSFKNNSEVKIQRLIPDIQQANVLIQRAVFEPDLYMSYSNDINIEQTTSVLFGVNPSKTRTIGFSGGYTQKLTLGTMVELDFLNTRTSSNSLIQSFNPMYDTNPRVSLSQPLMKGFGTGVNKTFFLIAKNNKARSQQEFAKDLMTNITNVKKTYYGLILAQELFLTAQTSSARTKSLYEINKAKYAKGLASNVDLLESEAEVARVVEAVFAAENNLRSAEDNLKMITNLVDDAETWNAKITALDSVSDKKETVDITSSILTAFDARPDYKAAKIELTSRDLAVVFYKNNLLPELDLTGSFALNGLSQDYGKALGHAGSGNYDDWSFGATFTMPLGSDAEKGQYQKAKIEKQQTLIGFKRLEQRIILEIRDAVRNVDTAYEMMEASRISKLAQEKNYAAQEERFKAGLVSTHDVTDYQERLTRAEVNYILSVVEYNIALAELTEAEGMTLAEENIKTD
jgi:outer membrane protein TolC